MSDDEARSPKVVPRNLTARAAEQPRGNPPGTRPESGPDNCFPGYDFDQRNLERRFFPGLEFTFHLGDDGVLVTRVLSSGPAKNVGLTDAHLPLFLWGLKGRSRPRQAAADPLAPAIDDVPRYSFQDTDAIDVWARVRDLLPGKVAILLGRQPPRIPGVPPAAAKALDDSYKTDEPRVEHVDGALQWVVLVGDRARYLDGDGVIDPQVYEAGELTRSLCAPWQFDFRDCVCSFWAANKPDLVASGAQDFAFYMRADRTTDPPPVDQVSGDGTRLAKGLDYAPLIKGAWNGLPVVLDDREVRSSESPATVRRQPRMSRDEFVYELKYLATVEHALAVQYLFAHYSLKAPIVLPDQPDDTMRQIFEAAREIFEIAVDEMRHLRWVNEALALFGEKPVLGRAKVIGRVLKKKFALLPLRPKQLEWFIAVEEPSRHDGGDETPDKNRPENVDGMYVRLLGNVSTLDRPDLRDRLTDLIKLIIDEGDAHYHRFLAVRDHLRGLQPEDYLRFGVAEKDPEPVEKDPEPVEKDPRPAKARSTMLLENSDALYSELLKTLHLSLGAFDRAGGVLLEQSRRTMRSLHETNHLLASMKIEPPFTLPEWASDYDYLEKPWQSSRSPDPPRS